MNLRVDEIPAQKRSVGNPPASQLGDRLPGHIHRRDVQPPGGEKHRVPPVAAPQLHHPLPRLHQRGHVPGKGRRLLRAYPVFIILVPIGGVVHGILHNIRAQYPLQLLHQLQRRAVAVVGEHNIGRLRLLEGEVDAHHVFPRRIKPLLVALEQGVPAGLDVDLLVVWDICPVPLPDAPVHGNGAHHHVDPLSGQQPAHPENALCPAQTLLLGVAHVLAKGPPDLVPVQQYHVGLGGLQPLVEQPAEGRLARSGQSGEKVYGSLLAHPDPSLSGTAAAPAAPGPAPAWASCAGAGRPC